MRYEIRGWVMLILSIEWVRRNIGERLCSAPMCVHVF